MYFDDFQLTNTNVSRIVSKFTIYDTDNSFLEAKLIQKRKIEDLVNEIENFQRATGIIIGNYNLTKYFIIFDYQLIIFNKFFFKIFHPFLEKTSNEKQLFFFNDHCKTAFQRSGSANSEPKNNIHDSQYENKTNFQDIKNQIANCIIRKSQIRTLNLHQTSSSTYQINEKSFNFKNFISIHYFNNATSLNFNLNDQFLYILKEFNMLDTNSKKKFEHEIDFYKQLGNKCPFISQYFGQVQSNNSKYVIIEYIEGNTLLRFIKNNQKQLSFIDKLLLILEIVVSIEFIHLNGIILRDLKWDNIIINSKQEARLIDFDNSKLNGSEDKNNSNVMTGNIGSLYFTAPEQFSTNVYSQKVDIYSLGMIIHFILTEKAFNFNPDEFYAKIQKTKENALNYQEIEKCPNEYQILNEVYKQCLEYFPDKRPNISKLLNDFFSNFEGKKSNDQIKQALKDIIKVREMLFKSFLKSSCEKKFDLVSEISYYFGKIYYFGDIVSNDINKSIYYLKISSDLNNSEAQCILGGIYCFGEYIPSDVNKAIYYLTLASNNNNPNAQWLLGEIYYSDEFIQSDIQKSIHYLTLASDHDILDAQLLLGKIYYNGKHVPVDIQKSIHYLTLASNKDSKEAKYLLGRIFYLEDTHRDIEKSIFYLTDVANNGDSSAQYLLGELYYDGQYVSVDIDKSIYYLTLASSQNSRAQFLLGHIYYFGEYVSRDIKKSVYYLTLASNGGNAAAQCYLGGIYLKEKIFSNEYDKGIYYLTQSANQNNADAQFILGHSYCLGQKVPRNINKSIFYLTLSANQGNQFAQYFLGGIYYLGYYTPCDIDKSIHYLILSSKQNNSAAQFLLGDIYYNGKFVPPDINKSIHYLMLSSSNNNSLARWLLGVIYYDGKYVSRDMNKAIYYLTLSANQYNSQAQFLLGEIYYFNKYVSRDINKSIYYFSLSANQGNKDAQYFLGEIYFRGEYVSPDINKSIHYLTLSANQYDVRSQFHLGEIFYSGYYISRDINKAIHYFKEASCFNDNKSKNNLAIIYKNGDGVNKNINLAIEYLTEAIKQENDSFSIYNLARIYLFGLGVEKNIPKSLELIEEKYHDGNEPHLNLLLFYIYSYIVKQQEKDKNKSIFYRLKVNSFLNLDQIEKQIIRKFGKAEGNSILCQRVTSFLMEYDMVYSINFNFNIDFSRYIMNGSFNFNRDNKNIMSVQRKEINKLFYDGFYN